MNPRALARTMVLVAALVACGERKHEGAGGGAATGVAGNDGAKATWLAAAWKPTEVDLEGVKVRVSVPGGLPVNDDFLLGKDWWVGANAEPPPFPAGPRLTLYRPKARTFDAETLARDIEPDPNRLDFVEVARETLPGGRVRYVSATNGNRHLDVTVWIPLADGARGIRCNAHWFAGSDATHPKEPPPPDPAILDWLATFCDSVELGAAAAAPAQ